MKTLDELNYRTAPALLRRNADRWPDKTFLTDSDGSLTYAETFELATKVAGGFQALGVRAGDRVGIMLDNRREFVAAWFGLSVLGAVEVPLNQQNVGPRLIHVLNHSSCRVLIVQSDYLPQVEAVRSSLEALETVVVIGDAGSSDFEVHSWSELADSPPAMSLPDVRLSRPSVVMYTSGSTGPAKGAVMPYGQHYMNGYQAVTSAQITQEDCLFICIPLHHNMGQGYGVMPALVAGAAIHLGGPFNRHSFWAEVTASGATVLPFVGAMLVLLAKNDPRPQDSENPLRVGYGVPIPAGVHSAFEERFALKLVHCYGSTEATIVTWGGGHDSVPGAVGRPFPGYQLRLVDEEDLPVPQGTNGQICVRADEPWTMFSGYLQDPERTADAWRNGWFHTGDRGRFDETGQLWFSDRLGDVIRCKGESVSAHEVEEVLVSHPLVALVAAYGVPNSLGDEDIVAAVVAVDGVALLPHELYEWSQSRLPRYALPRYIELVSEFPLTPTGKIEKFKLRSAGVSPGAFDARSPHPEQARP